MDFNHHKIVRGDIFFAEFEHATGSETLGMHPVIVVQNNAGNYYSNTIIGVVVTTQMTKAKIPTHVFLDGGQWLRDSVALAEQIYTIDKSRLKSYLGHLERCSMNRVDKAICTSLALPDSRTAETDLPEK